jgi:Bacterial mobilisation protein (MobC)
MQRDYMKVYGIDAELKEALKYAALKKFGKANASLMIRSLIDESIDRDMKKLTDAEKKPPQNIRFEAAIPEDLLQELEFFAESKLMTRTALVQAIFSDYLKKAPLLGDELAELGLSNYHLSKIGSNLNQVAKTLNTGGYLSKEFTDDAQAKIKSIRPDIRKHINLVLGILKKKEVIFETKKGGNRKIKKVNI